MENEFQVEKLVTKESPRQILSEDFKSKSWPISGGWGYTEEDAVILDKSVGKDFAAVEYQFLEFRTYEELIIFRPRGKKYAGIRFKLNYQALVNGRDGKSYDFLSFDVTCYKDEDFEMLKKDWESHNAYIDDEKGRIAHLQLAESKRISFTTDAWFQLQPGM